MLNSVFIAFMQANPIFNMIFNIMLNHFLNGYWISPLGIVVYLAVIVEFLAYFSSI